MFVKIDGITTVDDALVAVDAGADAVGCVFAPSARRVTVEQARAIVAAVDVPVLGVFVDEARTRVVEVAHEVGLRIVQLHGHESAADSRWISERVPQVFKAFAAGEHAIADAAAYGVDAVVVDTPKGGGGTGEAYDWSVAAGVDTGDVPVILAGGLTPDNVATAIAAARPWGVDVSSGVESGTPGRKDHDKLRAFVARARAATR